MSVALRYAARSHVGLGTKSRNEDSAYAGPELLVLCDGMGGHAAGDVASSVVVGELVGLDGESHGSDDMVSVLETAILGANARLAEVAEQTQVMEGMGTTCIAMLRSGNRLAVATIGDSRAYLRRGQRVTQITKDHSFVQKLLDEGRISQEEALHHPQRSLVTRVLTGREDDRPDLSMRELREGDRLLLASDGLTDYVAVDTVTDLLRSDADAGSVADQLIAMALKASVRDNVTVIVADVVPAGQGATKPQVVGAAGLTRSDNPSAPMTPAEKAAALAREVHGADDPAPELAEAPTRTGPAAWARRLVVVVAIVLVSAGGAFATYDWSQRQYYVGEVDGQVTVFRGVAQSLGPFALSEPVHSTDVALAALPTWYQQRVQATLSADSREGADTIVEQLRAQALPFCDDLEPTAFGDDAAATTGPPPDDAASTTGPPPDDAATTTGPRPDTELSTATAGPGSDSDADTATGPTATGADTAADTATATAEPPVTLPTPQECLP